MRRMETVFLNHGGGPMPLLGNDDATAADLRSLAHIGPTPAAILVISAHWAVRSGYAVTAAMNPPMLFDYAGFPPESYRYSYAAPGDPALAARVASLVSGAGLGPCALDAERGFDHGVFVPLMLAYPEATIPVLALSLSARLDAATHLALGSALRPLRDEGVLIIGSGSSYHNMGTLMSRLGGRGGAAAGRAFDDALVAACTAASASARSDSLANWTRFPGARDAHPRGGEEHLMPLFVVAGAAGTDRGVAVNRVKLMGAAHMSSFVFGSAGGETCEA